MLIFSVKMAARCFAVDGVDDVDDAGRGQPDRAAVRRLAVRLDQTVDPHVRAGRTLHRQVHTLAPIFWGKSST